MQFVPEEKDSCSPQLKESFELMSLGKADETKKGTFYEVKCTEKPVQHKASSCLDLE